MFDVIWTDHDRQLQGEHRAKKEAAAKDTPQTTTTKKQKRSSLSSKRGSVSSDSSPFSSFFRGHGLKRINTSDARSNTSSRLANPSPLATSFDGRSINQRSPRMSGAEPRPAGAAPGKCSGEQGREMRSVGDERSVDLSRHGSSIFSKYAESDALTSVSTGESMIEQSRGQTKSVALPQHTSNTRPSYENATWPRATKKSARSAVAPLSASLIPGPLSPAPPKRPSVRAVNLDIWRTPDIYSASFESPNFHVQPTIEVLTSMLAECTTRADEVLDVERWKEEIELRSNVKLNDVLQALRHIWGYHRKHEIAEEAEPKGGIDELRWMLWALKYLDPRPERDTSLSRAIKSKSNGDNKTLILYDSQEIATYLAATSSNSIIHHISTQHQPNSSSDAIKQLMVDSLHPNDFPPIDSYNTITTLTLPSLLPVVNIPPLLRLANHALLPGGSINLLLIDPLPRPGTLGRHMRSWLRTNLLPNIERSFRCLNPTALFPEWLAAASLRGEGSTITTTKFFANPARVQMEAFVDVPNAFSSNDHETRVTKAEIRSLTGRTLWMMIWGGFVSPGVKMWWDEPVCAEECVELGTIWEYHFIEGVKDAEAA